MKLRDQLHAVSPYEGFTPADAPDPQGWNSGASLFGDLIGEVRPALIIEVGSWKGGSALTMGRHVQRLGLACELVCVDTWLGAMEFWNPADAERYGGLRLRHGFPSVYYTFLSNIVHAGLEAIVTPFPISSVTGALWFRGHDVTADLIYIDASHEEEDVRADLEAYWPVLREGGVMFGDDFTTSWPGVLRAVRQFAEARRLALEQHDGFWVLRKTAGASTVATSRARTAAHTEVLRLAMVEAFLETTFPTEEARRAFFGIDEMCPLPLKGTTVRRSDGLEGGFELYSSTRFHLHAPPPPGAIECLITGLPWDEFRHFIAIVSVVHRASPDLEFIARVLDPTGAVLRQETTRLAPLASMAWHFALPGNIPAGSVLGLGVRVAWAAVNDFGWATWSSPMLFNAPAAAGDQR